MRNPQKTILLVGSGYMAREYAKVLKAQGLIFKVVGRSQESVDKFLSETGVAAVPGGIEKWLKNNKSPKTAIVAVTEDQLGIVVRHLINSGCKNILVEKPGGLDAKDIKITASFAKKNKSMVYVGYNRRFYASTQKALSMIKQDGGAISFNFDFTERSYVVEKLKKSIQIKKGWFLHNSTHLIDLAFFLGGWPAKMISYKRDSLKWHPSGAIYSGAGITKNGALFSYHADWISAGRWSIEIMTSQNKLIFRPLEKLRIQRYGSMTIEDVSLDDRLDMEFKPGLYRQVETFLKNPKKMLTIAEQVKNLKYYEQIQRGF